MPGVPCSSAHVILRGEALGSEKVNGFPGSHRGEVAELVQVRLISKPILGPLPAGGRDVEAQGSWRGLLLTWLLRDGLCGQVAPAHTARMTSLMPSRETCVVDTFLSHPIPPVRALNRTFIDVGLGSASLGLPHLSPECHRLPPPWDRPEGT